MIISNQDKTSSTENEKSYSLIVNYLPQTIKENDLIEIFSEIGPLKYCKLMKDKQTGYSYGFAFIQYLKSEQHGKLACQLLNGLQIAHKKIQVTQARPQSNETRNTKLYIKGFNQSFDEKQFYDLFSPFGQIIQIRILKDKLIAFIIMSTRTQAQDAIDHLHGLEMTPLNTLSVQFTQTDTRRDTRRHQIVSSLSSPNIHLYPYTIILDQYYLSSTIKIDSIYVYGLSQYVNKSELYQLFNKYGDVERVDIIMDNNTGLSKGYGFVLMNKYNQALTAIQQLNNYLFHGRYLQVRFKKIVKTTKSIIENCHSKVY